MLADRSANAGGLLLTRLERPVGEWELAVNQFARAVKPPEVPLARPVGALLGALLFLAVGFLLPLPRADARVHINARAAAKVAAVQAKAEALAKEEPLGSPMEEELRRLAEEVAEGRFDAADWEAADGLEQAQSPSAPPRPPPSSRGASEAAPSWRSAGRRWRRGERGPRARGAGARARCALTDGRGRPGRTARASRRGEGRAGTARTVRARESGGAGGSRTGSGGTGWRSRAPSSQGSGKTASAKARRQPLDPGLRSPAPALEQRPAAARRTASARATPAAGGAPASSSRRTGPGPGPEGARARAKGRARARVRPGSRAQGSQHASHRGKGGAGVGRGGESSPLVFGGEAEMDPDRLKFQPLPEGQGGEADELWGLQRRGSAQEGRPGRPSGGAGHGGAGRRDAGALHGAAAAAQPRSGEAVLWRSE